MIQVQEPKIPIGGDIRDSQGDEQNLQFRPLVPNPVDNQIQPQAGMDDSQRQEQMQIPIHNAQQVGYIYTDLR